MRTVEVTEFGGPDVLRPREQDDPRPGRGQVLIAVEVVEVIFLDTQLRSGWGQDFFPMRPPWVPGTGVAGRVTRVGDGVDPARVGARVVARTGNEGAYAELAVADSEDAFDVPDGLELAVATSALHDAVLALDRLERAALTGASRVLVTAAAGSLGQWFVPLAKAAGARVVGAAGGPDKVEAVTALGADVAVDYRRDGWADDLDGPFDVVFDGAGAGIGRTAFDATADGGLFFGHGAAGGDFVRADDLRGITVIGVDRQLDDETWRRLTRTGLTLLAKREVVPVVGQQVPLEQAADAHRAMAERTVVGKSVLTVRPRAA